MRASNRVETQQAVADHDGTCDTLTGLEEEKAESEALTASLRALLAIDEEPPMEGQKMEREAETDAASNFTRFLTELRGGF